MESRSQGRSDGALGGMAMASAAGSARLGIGWAGWRWWASVAMAIGSGRGVGGKACFFGRQPTRIGRPAAPFRPRRSAVGRVPKKFLLSHSFLGFYGFYVLYGFSGFCVLPLNPIFPQMPFLTPTVLIHFCGCSLSAVLHLPYQRTGKRSSTGQSALWQKLLMSETPKLESVEIRRFSEGQSIRLPGSYHGVILRRTGNVALLSRAVRPGALETYEVVIIRRRKKDRVFPDGRVVPAGTEYLPSDEDSGVWGWTYADRMSADYRFEALVVVWRERRKNPGYLGPGFMVGWEGY